MRTCYSAAALAASILAAACSGSSPGPAPSSTPESPSPSPSASPTSPPPSAVVNLRTGSATFTVSGNVKGRFKLPLTAGSGSTWNAGTGDVSLRYLDRSANALLLSGTVTGKSESTSSTLTLTFVVQDPSSIPFPSSRGECKVKLGSTASTKVSGNFTCSHLHSVGHPRKTVAVTGRFTASR